jgi:hypothetical protein
VPYRTPACHLPSPRVSDSRRISPPPGGTQCPQRSHDTHASALELEHACDYSEPRFAPVRGACQEVSHTKSRRSGPRKWLGAVVWLIAAGLHPRANATTLRVAEDLAARMDYDTGHARYCMLETAARLGIDKATVKRHVKYLRELGALAWVQHGTRTNVRPMLGLGGYAATATVYAAVIPPVYDHAMGHRIVGSGYTARIIVDLRHQQKPVDNPPVDNSASEGLAPPSLTVVKEESQVQLVGGFNYTSQASRDGESPTRPSKDNYGSNRTGRHALQVAQDILIARQVRPLVNWTQREKLRRLAFALRPLIDQGMDAYTIAGFLNGLCTGLRWRPKAPANYIRTVLTDRQQTAQRAAEAAARFELENPVEGAFRGSAVQQQSIEAALDAGLARLKRNAAANGWMELARQAAAEQPSHTDADAAADMAAFLSGVSA